MKPGDVVMWRSRVTPTGLAVDMGAYVLLKPVGTVPNYWEIQQQTRTGFDGRIVRAHVYEEDLISISVEIPVKQKLQLVKK